MDILVTNNPMAYKFCKDEYQIEFLDASFLDVLIYVRDLVHVGHALLTHPLSGSVKPNETPYKSVLLSKRKNTADEQSVKIIGECVLFAQKFIPRNIPDHLLKDMQVVDYSLIRCAIDSVS